MSLATIDWVLIAVYLAFSVGIALWYSKRASKSLGDYFLGGRSLPWYVLGISMVATTFAADTPLAVTEIVYQNGISGNWLWWNALIGGMLTTFFFAKLWRRAEVLTEVEFIAIRYSGAASRYLRGFKAVYLGVVMNVMIMGWVNVAFMGILQEFFGIGFDDALWLTWGAMLLVMSLSTLGGLLGVAVTDVVQFVIAMAGSVVLAVVVLNSDEIGGVSGLQEKLGEQSGVWNFLPNIGGEGAVGELSITVMAFLSFIGFQWWASWYPGAEPGGGGYVAQRMLSARSERDSVYATLFFQVAHYCLRPWPWIIVGLCALVLYPELGVDAKYGYVRAMRDFLPDGLRGLCLVAFLAAYMSTISTQLNWGASYLVNDLYQPFMRPASSDKAGDQKHYVAVSRSATALLTVLAVLVTSQIQSISAVWDFIFQCGAGLGLVLILRWFWWRINATTEIVATVTPFVVYLVLQFGVEPSLDADALKWWADSRISYFITIVVTTLAWMLTAFFTKPEPMERLEAFYQRVRPGGLWGPVWRSLGEKAPVSKTFPLVICWFAAVAMTYAFLFGTGELLLGSARNGWLLIGVAFASAAILVGSVRFWGLFKE